jgi:hypothetical protein
MATRDELISGVEMLIAESRRIASVLTDDDWARAVDPDGWNGAQVLAHIAGVGTVIPMFVNALASAPAGTDAMGGTGNVDTMNAGFVNARTGRSPAELAEEIAAAYGGVIEYLRGVSDDLLLKRGTAGGHRDVPLGDLMMRMVILHGLAHIYSVYGSVFYA